MNSLASNSHTCCVLLCIKRNIESTRKPRHTRKSLIYLSEILIDMKGTCVSGGRPRTLARGA